MIALATAVLSTNCTRSEGSFVVHFVWASGHAPTDLPSPTYALAHLRDASGHDAALAGPNTFPLTTPLSFQNITNGDGLTVLAELRDAPGLDSQVLYYGLSAPFSLSAGATVDVPVTVKLQPPPQSPPGWAGILNQTVRIEGAEQAGTTNSVAPNLILVTDTGVSADISNLPGLPAGAATMTSVALGSPVQLEGVPAGFQAYRISGWNLNAGIDSTCTTSGGCQRSVYVRFIDANQERSPVSIASVRLDTEAPKVDYAAVTYIPPIGAPLATVSKATVGTVVTVTLFADEILATDSTPTLVAINGSNTISLPMLPGTLQAQSCLFQTTVPPGAVDGTYVPQVTWKDAAGNSGTLDVPQAIFEFKTSPPTLTIDQSQVAFVRSPWGNSAPETFGSVTIPAGPTFSLSPINVLSDQATLPASTFSASGGVALIRIWGDPQKTLLIAAATPGSDGSWPRIEIPPNQFAGVYVSAVDEAGNESTAQKIERAEWVATVNVPAGTAVIPHNLNETPFANVTPVGSLPGDTSPAAGRDAQAVLATAEAAWVDRAPSSATPDPRHESAMAFDARRGRIVLFGGLTSSGMLSDTWEWDGASWQNVTPALGSPFARAGHVLVYDSDRGRVDMLDGLTNDSTMLDEIWEWDSDNNEWNSRGNNSNSTPGPRTDLAAAYDASQHKIVIFGGQQEDRLSGGTWAFDGDQWAELMPLTSGGAQARPAPRWGASMVYDATHQKLLLFGGVDGTGTPLADFWAFDWTSQTWQPLNPPGSTPTARFYAAMVYDSAQSVVRLFGGAADMSFATTLADTWTWDGTVWTESSMAAPAARAAPAAAYDDAIGGLVIFGGAQSNAGTTTDLDDLWVNDGTTWQEPVTSVTSPGPLTSPAMAFDPDLGVMLAFGGSDGTLLRQDLWSWNGSTWTSIPVAGAWPEAREETALAYDTARHRLVLFGGQLTDGSQANDTWEWDGSTWTQASSMGAPPVRSAHAMVYDANQGVVVLFGGLLGDSVSTGQPGQDTWTWNGQQWKQQTPGTAPDPRFSHALAYDVNRHRTVLFGGLGAAGDLLDTWEWDGTAWTAVTPAGEVPPPRDSHVMAFDSMRNRVILLGGFEGGVQQNDQWEWDGTTWVSTTPTVAPPPNISNSAAAYDSIRRRLVVFGGLQAGVGTSTAFPSGDVWELNADPSRQPALEFDVDASNAGFGLAQVTGVRVRATCGGTGSVGGDGVTLLRWSSSGYGFTGGPWLPVLMNAVGLASTTSPDSEFLSPTADTLLDWSAASVADAQEVMREYDLRPSFQCRAIGSTGTGTTEAAVAMDYIELRVQYAP